MILTALKVVSVLVVAVAAMILVARVVFALPDREEAAASVALPPAETGRMADALRAAPESDADRTGVVALPDGPGAFASRVLLADAAVQSIDAQYYIWHGDLTGVLLLDALKRAADRGVRVRLLLDDNGTSGLDRELAALNAHPSAEVRLWNPFNLRRMKVLSYAFDFFRLNRRMHNKSFTVDGLATIVGGRNVGDEYFGTGQSALYIDLDVIAVGAAVEEVGADFDRYWASPSVYPVGQVIPHLDPGATPVEDALMRASADPQFEEYREVLANSQTVRRLLEGELAFEWTDVTLVSDDPRKGQGRASRDDLLAERLATSVGRIEHRLDGVSPYFVPGAQGVRAFVDLASRGVEVRLLTNSQAATDVMPVHAGYAKRREALLAGGVSLFELKSRVAPGAARGDAGPFGSSGASLHAKTFAVDGNRIYVGSFNFDPRSTLLNTEMGFLIESERLAGRLHEMFDNGLPAMAYEVILQDGDLAWREAADGTSLLHEKEPETSAIERAAVTVIGWLPVEWLL